MYDDYFKNYGTQPTYQNDYDEYLGYENNYDRFMPRQVNSFPYANNAAYSNQNSNTELSKTYPEIYNKILPIIEKKLGINISSMDNATLERLTFEVYDEFTSSEIGKKLNVQTNSINTSCSTCTTQNSSKISNQDMNRNIQPSSSNNLTQSINSRKTRSNYLLCDLIKIMILNNWKEKQRLPRPERRSSVMPNPRPWSQNIIPNRYGFSESYTQNQNVSHRPNYFDVPYPEDFRY